MNEDCKCLDLRPSARSAGNKCGPRYLKKRFLIRKKRLTNETKERLFLNNFLHNSFSSLIYVQNIKSGGPSLTYFVRCIGSQVTEAFNRETSAGVSLYLNDIFILSVNTQG